MVNQAGGFFLFKQVFFWAGFVNKGMDVPLPFDRKECLCVLLWKQGKAWMGGVIEMSILAASQWVVWLWNVLMDERWPCVLFVGQVGKNH